ncbi:MAG: D-alanine--D-alanine ligase, partial [Chitinivibrionales bacterium]|nr:D-alanine--D-alanine ligase [Chitinivibrionales bacterium]
MPLSRKLRVAVLFGGKSAEHEVSLQSARGVIDALDRERFEPVLIGIDKGGSWRLLDSARYLLNATDPKLIALNKGTGEVSLAPAKGDRGLVVGDGNPIGPVDIAFPVLHGPYGEDGSVQGLLRLAGIPFVGAGVLGSAVGMDKDVMKRLLRDAGLPIADFVVVNRHDYTTADSAAIGERLGLPVFVKPANMGSSVGISKVSATEALADALALAFEHDTKVIVEAAVAGRELECAVLGNDTPHASVVGEVLADTQRHGFYSYEAKYIDEHGAVLSIPAEIDESVAERARDMALQAFRVLCCEGLARVDFFLTPGGRIVINEINTM